MRLLTSTLVLSFLMLFIHTAHTQSLNFDGMDDYATIPRAGNSILGDFSVPHDFTIEIMFKFTGTTLKKKILAMNGDNTGIFIETDVAGNLLVGYGNDVTWASEPTGFSLTQGVWYHVAFAMDISHNAFRVYVNGTEIGQFYQLINNNYGGADWSTLFGGAYSHGTYNWTMGYSERWGENGAITFDYIRFWDVMRTDAEILANYNIPVSCSATNLLAQYEFTDGTAGANNSSVTTLSDCTGNGFTANLSNFDMTGMASNFISETNMILPVEMTSFEGFAEDNRIILNWSTASEEINEGFYVERSENGENWTILDFVQGNGTTLEPQYYLYEDNTPKEGVNYYRLKQMDFDGNFEYSEIIEVEFVKGERVAVKTFPNPASKVLNVRIPNLQDEQQAVIMNMLGQAVRQVTLTDETSMIPIEDLPSGTYFLRLLNNEYESQNIKFIKQ